VPVHPELHRTEHIGWLRAAVLGANDGLISTSSLVVGVAAAQAARGPVLLAAIDRAPATSPAVAAGEYVSVSSQSDTEDADLTREKKELAENPEFETVELATIYEGRGLTPELARQVADQLMAVRRNGPPLLRGAIRVTFWGAVAMAATALVGRLFGTVV
jgi:vacuolar iron transporter family protein